MYGDEQDGVEGPAGDTPPQVPAKKKRAPAPKKAKAAPKNKKKAPVKKTAKPKGEKKPRAAKQGVGALIRELIKEKKWTHAQIVDKSKKAFPDSDTDTKDVTWQKWAMKTGKVK